MDQKQLNNLVLGNIKKYKINVKRETGMHYLTLRVEKDDTLKLLKELKQDKELRFTMLTDQFGVDFPERAKRFDVVFNLLSFKLNMRVVIKVVLADNEVMPTAVKVFSAANWYEREIFDLYGITFDKHPDIRRILTDYGFQGHPLRKDFPVTGYVEVRYDEDQEKVIYEPVKLDQEFRNFDFMSPWEGAEQAINAASKTKVK